MQMQPLSEAMPREGERTAAPCLGRPQSPALEPQSKGSPRSNHSAAPQQVHLSANKFEAAEARIAKRNSAPLFCLRAWCIEDTPALHELVRCRPAGQGGHEELGVGLSRSQQDFVK